MLVKVWFGVYISSKHQSFSKLLCEDLAIVADAQEKSLYCCAITQLLTDFHPLARERRLDGTVWTCWQWITCYCSNVLLVVMMFCV